MLKSVERPRKPRGRSAFRGRNFTREVREMGAATVRVGLAGCGVVGGALVRLLDESADTIESRYGVRLELSRVLVRDTQRDRGLPLPSSVFTSDRNEFLSHDTDVVVEAIGGTGTASEICLLYTSP